MWEEAMTGTFTLLGVGLGGWLQHKTSRSAIADQLRETRRAELHRHLAGLVADVRTKVELAWLHLPMFAKMSNEDMTEFVETDSGREMGEREQRIHRARAELALLLGEGELRTAFLALDQCLTDWPEKAMDPVTNRRPGVAAADAAVAGFQHVKLTSAVLDHLEAEASRVLSVQLG